MSQASLQFAKDVSAKANDAWLSGEYLERVTPTTKQLLTYWFGDQYCENRGLNFHEGQRQAILNIIYLHEVLKTKNIFEAYEQIAPDLLLRSEGGLAEISKTKYSHPKYAIKMATGTGKTWVLSATLIWQYLNAKHEDGNFTKNFLVVAPGLIVYERLLDAFLGKEREGGDGRDFESSDIFHTQDLFLPESYREEIFGFFKSSVVIKEEIGSKVTGDGLVAVTNWHLLAGVAEDASEEIESPGEIDPVSVMKSILPTRPSASAGNDLNVLDNSYGQGKELAYLRDLTDLMVFNDEAHHLASNAQEEKHWQRSLSHIAETKSERFVQVDFSATPYDQIGKKKIYFPHIIVDFELKTAIQKGYVKTLVLDRRKEIASMELDFKAERDESGKVIGLSEGQRVMLRAGLKKLQILEADFEKIAPERDKYPKMMIVCEDTKVAPFVSEFLVHEGLSEDDVLEIHSDKKGNVTKEAWSEIKNKLFHLDEHKSPKIIVSVLMLREGFDVNNICVIVPLRSSQAPILLEQTIGRGLRQMWREPEFKEIKEENRRRMLVEKTSPQNYFDILSIIEHPAFIGFYDELMQDGMAGVDDTDITEGEDVTGDIISVGLRAGYEKYDFIFPVIVSEAEEVIKEKKLSIDDLNPFDKASFEQLKKMVKTGEQFVSQEMTKGTRFGDYSISGGIMTATSYNEFVSRLVNRVSVLLSEPVSGRHLKEQTKFPAIQIKLPELAGLVDGYIRRRLFSQEIDPFVDENWRILMVNLVVDHIIREVSTAILKLQETESVNEPEVIERRVSEVASLRMRESYSFPTSRSIYERLPYPSRNGGLEKGFIEYADADTTVEAFVKLLVEKHYFIRFRYLKEDGLMAQYYPDFLVKCNNGKIYIVETKAQDQISHPNVQKKQISALNWIDRVNALPAEMRRNASWEYVIIGDTFFNDWKSKGASIVEMLEFAKLRAKQGGQSKLL
ncbi:DEAD/DEAH box helicase family protein [Candidatus Gracilibacteria bacterium]|nr:DEAD/DEAH box helicase family protein [Candidatus Gracilibacteria bacterium]